MSTYKRPEIIIDLGMAEGVYAASGDNAQQTNCDSKYMKGVWQAPDYSAWDKGYKKKCGCMGCPAYRWNGCGMQLDYVNSGNAGSYDQDKGNRMPAWEKKGYGPDDQITDWSV